MNLKLIELLGVIGLLIGAYAYGYHDANNANAAKERNDLIIATAKVRKEEQQKQEVVNVTVQRQADNLAAINDQLNHDIEQLQQRARRRNVSNHSQAECKGATGSSLYAEDSEFLRREAARADQLRAALQACYAYADTVGGKP